MEQLVLGHHRQPGVDGQGHGDEKGVPPADVVGAQESAALRQILQPDGPVGEEQPDERRDKSVYDAVKTVHSAIRSLMMSRICRRLCWKVLPVVSSTTASSAGRSGAAARWVSL